MMTSMTKTSSRCTRFTVLLIGWIGLLFLRVTGSSIASVAIVVVAAQVNDGDDHDHDNNHHHDISSSQQLNDVVEHWPLYKEQLVGLAQVHTPIAELYTGFMLGCYHYSEQKKANPTVCDQHERNRLTRNEQQPPTIQNYTELGFAELPIHEDVSQKIRSFFQHNKKYIWDEFWNPGNIAVNYWNKPTMQLDIGRKDYPSPRGRRSRDQDDDIVRTRRSGNSGGGNGGSLSTDDKLTMVALIQRTVETWIDQPVILTGSHGIKCYQSGTIIPPTVNHLPHVVTAIVHVERWGLTSSSSDDDSNNNNDDDDNTANEWPFQVLGHDGHLYNVTQSSGGTEMIVLEGASVIHGRPYPLGGQNAYYCDLMFHFEPLGYTVQHEMKMQRLKEEAERIQNQEQLQEDNSSSSSMSDKAAFDAAMVADQTMYSTRRYPEGRTPPPASSSVPHYIWPAYISSYRQQTSVFESVEGIYPKPNKVIFGKINAHTAASLGDLISLKELARTDRNELFKADQNGWRPIHEAARSGHADVLEYLIDEGAEINERTNNGKGGNPLFWAEKDKIKNAKAIAVLKKYGAINLPPNLR